MTTKPIIRRSRREITNVALGRQVSREPLAFATTQHGTWSGYVYRGCRCYPCCEAGANYMRDWRAKKRSVVVA